MTEFTTKQFRLEFGFKPGKAFDLNSHLTEQHKIDAMANPSIAIVRGEYGTLKDPVGQIAHYMLKVAWWMAEDPDTGMRIRGRIDGVILFDDLLEMKVHMKKAQVKSTGIITNQN